LTAAAVGGSLSPNLLVNGDFSEGTAGWSFLSPCFSIDPTTLAPNGAASLEFSPASTCTEPIALNSFSPTGGQAYTLSGEIQTEDYVGTKSSAAAMFDIFEVGRSPLVSGTTAWTSATLPHLVVPTSGVAYSVRLQNYGSMPTGNAWFANMSLQRELPPELQVFLLYPNYRGLMFSDQSQVASMDLIVTPPAGTSLSGLQVVIAATDSSGNIVASQNYTPAATEFTGTLDMTSLPLGTYQVAGILEDSSGNVLLAQSPYAIVKLDASVRSGMKAWIDSANLAHFIDGNSHFVLGIYDTTGYSYGPADYMPELTAIAQAPINMIINYFLCNAPTKAITAYTTAMKSFGITFLPTVNNFYSNNADFPTAIAKEFGTDDQDQLISDYASTLSSDPGVVGYYVGDEPPIRVQPETFHQYSLIKANDPSGFNLAVIGLPPDLPFWKDSVDVLGVDPYPILSASGNDLASVAKWTREAFQAGHGSRPVWTVIQFFQTDLESAWPTQQQLHDMSWMAIVEGATGLFYWSYGEAALGWVKNPAEHAALYRELINVTTEIKSLEPVLLSPDAAVITANSALGTVFTKTKVGADGTRYLFSYNYTASEVTAEFTLAQPAASIIDYDTGVGTAPDTSTTFSGTFQPYQAHIFLISDSAPVPTPIPSATPTPIPTATPSPLATATRTPTMTATRTPTMTATRTPTVTATRTPTVIATRTPTVTATRTPTATPTRTATPTASATPTAMATPGTLSISPAILKFGPQRLATASSAKTLKVINASGATAKINGISITGGFAQTNTCGASLAAHNTCDISVTFEPTAKEKRTGTLSLKDNATNSPQVVNLNGK
jgi:hypothetical protein